MTTSVPGPTRQGATTAKRAPWYVWGLVGLATMASGPVVGGGFDHPTLLVGGVVVFLVGSMTIMFLTRLTRMTFWLSGLRSPCSCGLSRV